MPRRAPLMVIGVLIGIVVMQWAMPVADGQTYGQVVAASFWLVDSSGNTLASLSRGTRGPLLSMATTATQLVNIGIDVAGETAFITLQGEGGDALVNLRTDLPGSTPVPPPPDRP